MAQTAPGLPSCSALAHGVAFASRWWHENPQAFAKRICGHTNLPLSESSALTRERVQSCVGSAIESRKLGADSLRRIDTPPVLSASLTSFSRSEIYCSNRIYRTNNPP